MTDTEVSKSISSIIQKLNDLENNIRYTKEDKAKRRKIQDSSIDIDNEINLLTMVSNQYGLLPEQIDSLSDALTNELLDLKYVNQLIRCLNPRTYIDKHSVLMIVGSLTMWKQREQLLALKWLTTGYLYMNIDAQLVLESCYGFFFNLLGYEYMTPYLCMLLYYTTTAKKVTNYRVRYLLSLFQKASSTGQCCMPLHVLLSLYVHFYNNVRLPPKPKSNKGMSIFLYGDKKWRERMNSINLEKKPIKNVFSYKQKGSKLLPEISNDINKDLNMTPDLYTYSRNTFYKPRTVVTFNDIHSITDLCTCLFNTNIMLFLPSQGLSILDNLYFSMYTSLFPQAGYIYRYNYTYDLYSSAMTVSAQNQILMLLKYVYKFTLYSQTIPESLLSYLYKSFQYYADTNIHVYLLKFIPYLPFCDYDTLYHNILHPISFYYLQNNQSYSLYSYLSSISLLLSRYKTFLFHQIESNEELILIYEDTMKNLSQYMDRFYVKLFSLQAHPLLYINCLSFLSSFPIQPVQLHNYIHLPSQLLFTYLLLSPHPFVISKLGVLLTQYYHCIQIYKTLDPLTSLPSILNAYMIDYLNIYYNNKPLVRPHSLSSLGDTQESPSLWNIDSLSYYQQLYEQNNKNIPMTLFSIYSFSFFFHQFVSQNQTMTGKDLRNAFIKYLEEKGYDGIVQFKDTFLKKKESTK